AELETYEALLEHVTAAGRTVLPWAGIPYVGMAEVAYQRNDLGAALADVREGIALCGQMTYQQPLAIGLADLAWIQQAQGNPTGALATMRRAVEAAPGREVVDLFNPVPVSWARMVLAQ